MQVANMAQSFGMAGARQQVPRSAQGKGYDQDDFDLQFSKAQEEINSAVAEHSEVPVAADPVSMSPEEDESLISDDVVSAQDQADAAVIAVMALLASPVDPLQSAKGPADGLSVEVDLQAPNPVPLMQSVLPAITDAPSSLPQQEDFLSSPEDSLKDAAAFGADILERPADIPAEARPLQMQPPVQGVMDDAAVQTVGLPVAEDALARMPKNSIELWKLDQDGAQDADPGSLENVSVEERPVAPPSRLEITQVVSPRRETADVLSDRQAAEPVDSVKPELPLAAQGASFPTESVTAADTVIPAPGAQIVEEAQIQQAMGKTQFTMKLRPESLGEVIVRLTMAGDGVTARIITRTEDARIAIAQELASLGDSMREKGIDVRHVQVVDSSMGQASLLHDGGGSRSREQGRRSARPGNRAQRAEAAEPAAIYSLYSTEYSTEGLADNAGIEVTA